jgi:hypothetical protein
VGDLHRRPIRVHAECGRLQQVEEHGRVLEAEVEPAPLALADADIGLTAEPAAEGDLARVHREAHLEEIVGIQPAAQVFAPAQPETRDRVRPLVDARAARAALDAAGEDIEHPVDRVGTLCGCGQGQQGGSRDKHSKREAAWCFHFAHAFRCAHSWKPGPRVTNSFH